MLNRRLIPALVLAGALVPGIALANYSFPASMNAGEEVPTNGSLGKAVGTLTIDNNTNTLNVNLQFHSLTSNTTAAHVHGLASRGTNAGVLITLPIPTGVTSGSIVSSHPLTPHLKQAILSGQTYLNIHTVNNGGGEIRGQIDSVTATGKGVPGASTNGLVFLTLALAATAAVVLSRRRLMA